ncbi:MAG TPA: T9SS type A sorting domain-containing protein [Saprospiraceae bacterium]|nr:T9SS type A sorting domain-containing protein [Saprospiraceae bacterium]HMQ82708.1 T9SS type A sorting domain-containing protein [Saprospiraceae bacterium]
MIRIVSFFLCIALAIPLFSQQPFARLNLPFEIFGQQLPYPLTGGLNNPQLSAVDLNQDGKLDLLVFDRTGNVWLTFLNVGTPGQSSYTYAPEFESRFPAQLKDWVLLRDFNGDGIMDLFAQSDFPGIQGIMVYRGYYENNKIAFERVNFDNEPNLIFFKLPNNTFTNLLVSNVDYPAIDDMDCDGDLDILTFNVAGGYVELYTNQSLEKGYGLDSLIFELMDNCWGGFFELSIQQEVATSSSPGDCYNLQGEGAIADRHPGSTLLTFDADNDGDKDLVLGDITYATLNFLTNDGDCDLAWVEEQDTDYPSYDVSADIPVFPVAFLLDLNNDGLKDLAAAPNPINIAENHEVLWFYENTGSNEVPVFSYVQDDFLVENTIDLGTGASPALVDYNADGLLDIVVGNRGLFEPFGERDTRLFLYKNIGSANDPAFRLEDDNYLNLNIFDDNYSFSPTFGDLDNDGDLDILVGEELGRLFYAENTAGAGNPMAFGPWQYGYKDLFVSGGASVSSPAIADLNRDGLPDIIVGERTGNVNYFQNIGTASTPVFDPNPENAPNTFLLGGIDTRIIGSISGYSAPAIYDTGDDFIFVTGSEDGHIEFHNQVAGNIYGNFVQQSDAFGQIKVGRLAKPAIADLDNDGLLDIVVGNERGGLSAYRTNVTVDGLIATRAVENSLDIQFFPNPAQSIAHIQLPFDGDKTLELWDTQGRLLKRVTVQEKQVEWPVSELPEGVYWLRVMADGKQGVVKLVKA